MFSLAEYFSSEKEDVPHSVKTIMQYWQNDKPLIENPKWNKGYSIKHFHKVED